MCSSEGSGVWRRDEAPSQAALLLLSSAAASLPPLHRLRLALSHKLAAPQLDCTSALANSATRSSPSHATAQQEQRRQIHRRRESTPAAQLATLNHRSSSSRKLHQQQPQSACCAAFTSVARRIRSENAIASVTSDARASETRSDHAAAQRGSKHCNAAMPSLLRALQYHAFAC